ncbi:chloride channel protein (plasmid) [Streptomyces sp. CA-294286]|uniref:chloride channel protein n=1 Tax=Streptomyces sp. CA-294286 TaxID=3240070 RepID=UPI003D8D3770
MTAAGPASSPATEAEHTDDAHRLMLSGRYLRLLLLSVLLGAPIAVACFFFVGLQHWLQHEVWTSLPAALGYEQAPWWWPLPALALAGLILAPIVSRFPGRGGHLPVDGLGGAPIGPRVLPGVVVAALATLPLGVVLGPEAPLMAVGSALALLALRRFRGASDPRTATLVATVGSTAAISTILGGPLVAALLVVEAAGLAGVRLAVLLLPCLAASAAGAVVFAALGTWTGLPTGGLALPAVPPAAPPDAGDFLWGVPLAALIACAVALTRRFGRRVGRWTCDRRTARRTGICAVAVGVCLSAYALITGRSPGEAALSGQETLGELAAQPGAWPVTALLALVVCKGLAWSISLGSLRGGPIFPALLLGAAAALACAALPGLGTAPALALGICAASTAITGLPLCSAVLTVLLLGADAHEQMPLVAITAVVAHLAATCVNGRARQSGEP